MATNMTTKTPRELLAECAEQLSTDGHYELAHELAALRAQQVPMTPQQAEALAVEHEAFGFGQVDDKGWTTHGFDPDGIHNFVRAIEAFYGIAAKP